MLAQSSRFGLLLTAAVMSFATSADAQRAPVETHRVATMAGKSPVYAPNGVAATSQPLATTAAIEVMERVTGRPCVWATAQFLSYAVPPATLELDVKEVVRGHHISQARVIAHVGDTEILTVLGSLGSRTVDLAGQWAVMPDVPSPDDCPPRPMMDHHEGRISSRLDAFPEEEGTVDDQPIDREKKS